MGFGRLNCSASSSERRDKDADCEDRFPGGKFDMKMRRTMAIGIMAAAMLSLSVFGGYMVGATYGYAVSGSSTASCITQIVSVSDGYVVHVSGTNIGVRGDFEIVCDGLFPHGVLMEMISPSLYNADVGGGYHFKTTICRSGFVPITYHAVACSIGQNITGFSFVVNQNDSLARTYDGAEHVITG
jgi:hypothetical protein